MRRYLAVLFALSPLGCDDVGVANKVADVLERGAVLARVECDEVVDLGGFGAADLVAVGVLFQDGSAFSSGATSYGSSANFQARVATEPASRFYINTDPVDLVFASGLLSVSVASSLEDTVDLGTNCTGFNLEAFGVE